MSFKQYFDHDIYVLYICGQSTKYLSCSKAFSNDILYKKVIAQAMKWKLSLKQCNKLKGEIQLYQTIPSIVDDAFIEVWNHKYDESMPILSKFCEILYSLQGHYAQVESLF
jgi:hypothetical protein